ncbi:stereocilin-like [Protopterus annectens]|uniref:stereocilin-like n=1 Tax=Protopterus annectens TaxID=7888 RepID=UPI001CF941BB|nr:stereocilin-like [Protopterus annectens]
MPRETFKKLLMSAEKGAARRFLSHMHRTWPQLQVSQTDEQAMESLASTFLQKFPRLTPELFIDLSQFIPFMSVFDILSLPDSLLLNDTVLLAIHDHGSEMRAVQKRAFAKRLLQANVFGEVPSWPEHFLESILPLLPHLPLYYFQKLTPQQITPLIYMLERMRLDFPRGLHFVKTILNQSKDITLEDMERLGHLSCFVAYEDLLMLLSIRPVSEQLLTVLLECLNNGTISTNGRVAYSLAQILQSMDIRTFSIHDLIKWRVLLPETGLDSLLKVSPSSIADAVSGWDSGRMTPAQAYMLLKPIVELRNVTLNKLCELHPLWFGLSHTFLQELPPSALERACPCLKQFLSESLPVQRAAVLQSLEAVNDNATYWVSNFKCLIPFLPLKLLMPRRTAIVKDINLLKDLPWSHQQAQFIFGQLQQTSNLTTGSLLSLGRISGGVDCDTLQQWFMHPKLYDLIRYINEQQGGLRGSLRTCIIERLMKQGKLSQQDVSQLGPDFTISLPVKLIEGLSRESVPMVLEHLTRHFENFLNFMPHKQRGLLEKIQLFLGVTPGTQLSGPALNFLGPLIPFLDKSSLSHIDRDNVLLHMDDFKIYCLPEEFMAWFRKLLIKENILGDLANWRYKQVELLGRLIFTLSEEDIYSLPKAALTENMVEMLLTSQKHWEKSLIGLACIGNNATLHNMLKKRKQSLIEAGIWKNPKGKREPIPTCADIRGTYAAAWSSTQLGGMSASEFGNCLPTLSQDKELSADQLKAALAKAKQLFGPVRTLNTVHVLQLGQLATQLTEKELREMDISELGLVAFLGQMQEWSSKQMKAIFTNFLHRSGNRIFALDMTELTALGHFVCGMKPDEIDRINPEEFSKAVLFIGQLNLRCNEVQMESMAQLCTSEKAFGPVSHWGPEIFTEIGTVAAGLPDMVLSSLVEPQIQGLTPEAISLIPPKKLVVVFSTEQLSSFTQAQAAAITPVQYEQLNPEQKQVITMAQYEGEVKLEQRGKSTADLLKPLQLLGSCLTFLCVIIFLK